MSVYRNLRPGTSLDYVKSEIEHECLSPVRTKLYNYETGKYEWREVPCGKCLNCRYKNQQKWVKRMQQESDPEINKYVYFVTLTYSPDFLAKNKTYRDETYAIKVKKKWLPLLLCRKHLSLYFQRLRKSKPGIEFTYYACGEYGEDMSRPHFHFILWSNTPFTEKDFSTAWTLRGTQIGRIQVDDLVQNGTLSDLRSDSPMAEGVSSSHISKYVAKYVNKLNHSPLESMATEKYIRKVYRQRYIKTHTYDRPLNRDLTHISKTENKYINKFIEQYGKEELNEEYCIFNKEKAQVYRYSTVEKFFEQFLPYTTCSKANAIGERYIQKYVTSKEDLLKRNIYNNVGQKLTIPQNTKRKLIRKEFPILPINPLTNNTSETDLIGVSDLLQDIHSYILGSYTQNRRFDYKNNWLFTDRTYIYNLKSTGECDIFDYKSSEYRETITIDEFETLLKLEEYLSFKRTYSKEINEYIETKIDYFNQQVQLAGLQRDFTNFKKQVIKNKMSDFFKKNAEYKFKHKQF